jgi:hypothetical protein
MRIWIIELKSYPQKKLIYNNITMYYTIITIKIKNV